MFSFFFFVSSANVFSVGNIRNPHALPLFSCPRATFSTQRIGFLFDEIYIVVFYKLSVKALWLKFGICIGNSMICSDIWHKYHE